MLLKNQIKISESGVGKVWEAGVEIMTGRRLIDFSEF